MNSIKKIVLCALGLSCLVYAQKKTSLDALKKELSAAQGKTKSLNLEKMVPGLFGNVSSVIKKAFNNNFVLKNIRVTEEHAIPTVKDFVGHSYQGRARFSGTLKMGNSSIDATLNVYEDRFKNNVYSFVITLPKGHTISQTIPQLKLLDTAISLSRPQLVFSEFTYINEDGVGISDGLNFVSLVNLTGAFKLFGELRDKAKVSDAIVADAKPIILVGKIPSMLDSFSFTIVMPIRFGVDFRKIKKLPPEFSKFLQKVTTDHFIVSISVGTDLTITLKSGIQLTFGSQKEPIIVQAFGTIGLTGEFSFGGRIPSMIELKSVAIGDAGIEFIVDPKILPATLVVGIPFTGLGFTGRIDLGKDITKRASLALAAKVALAVESFDFAFDVVGKNLVLDNLIYLLGNKAAVPKDKVPVLKINEIEGRFIPWPMSIAGKPVEEGYELTADVSLFGNNFGMTFEIKPTVMILAGKGWMPPLKIVKGGKMIFQFTGAGKDLKWGTADDSPYVHFYVDPKHGRNVFAISGMFEIPALALKNKIDLLATRYRFTASVESRAVGFGVAYDINIDPVKWRDMHITFKFKDDFDAFLSKHAAPMLKKLESQATKKVEAAQKKLTPQVKKVSGVAKSAVSKEITKTKKTIKRIRKKIKKLKKECKKAGIKAPIICPKTVIEIAIQKEALKAQKLYLNTILKPGAKVVKKAAPIVKQVAKKVAAIKPKINLANQVVAAIQKGGSLFRIKEAAGGASMKELVAGKLPVIKKLVMEMTIPGRKKKTITLINIPFDFTNPVTVMERIIPAIVKSLGGKK